jgi:glycosyltransferase involved in cell wall biosynthesis
MTKSENFKISIITVVYNGKEYLEETIKSVIDQDFKDFEYIVVDGKSTDGTVDVIKKHEKYIDKWVSEKDRGIYDAMNKGSKSARGEYLYFLNAGDYFCDKNVLKKINQHLKYDLVVGSIVRKYPNYDFIHSLNNESIKNIKHGKMPPHQGSFIKKDVFDKLKGYNIEYKSSGDLDFFCKFYKNNNSYIVIDKNIAFMPSGGMSSNKNISVNESYQIIKKHFGLLYAYLYYLNKMIIEQGVKKILIFLGLRSIYEKLLKIKMRGF